MQFISRSTKAGVLFDWLSHTHLGYVHCREADEAGRKPRECKLMFERYTRDRGSVMVPCGGERRAFTPGPLGSSFLYLYRRGNGRGTRLSRTDFPGRVRFRGGCTGSSTLKTAPPFRIMSSFVSPLLEKETVYIFPLRREFSSSSFLFYFLSSVDIPPAFSSTTPLTVFEALANDV